jgi:hypothetical protein
LCRGRKIVLALHPPIESRGPKALDRTTVPVRNCKLTVNLMAHPCAVASFRSFTFDLE